jgi:hypothetical protein
MVVMIASVFRVFFARKSVLLSITLSSKQLATEFRILWLRREVALRRRYLSPDRTDVALRQYRDLWFVLPQEVVATVSSTPVTDLVH